MAAPLGIGSVAAGQGWGGQGLRGVGREGKSGGSVRVVKRHYRCSENQLVTNEYRSVYSLYLQDRPRS